jgi:glucose-6-phosphate 1-epimerase
MKTPHFSENITIKALGAQLWQARLDGSEVFYQSPLPPHTRGGVPVLFPQFADTGSLPKHGWARQLLWKTIAAGYAVEVLPRADWPHQARLQLLVEKSKHRLEIFFSVTNIGSTAFAWTGGLHPYFRLENLLNTQVLGLQGVACQDRYQPDFTQQQEETLGFDEGVFERLYRTDKPLLLQNGAQRLRLTSAGFSDWMFWNPGAQHTLPDLPAEDWMRFICIEPVSVSQPVPLAAGETFHGSLSIESA